MDQKRKEVGGKFCVNGKIYPIYGGVNPIGRNREAVVNIKSLGVSQQHALFILVDDDLHFISDLKSSNGTFLDSKRIDPLQLYRLENGSRVKFADIEGIYSKLTSVDVENQGNFSTFSENTQNFTQNFYGSDTQIMDNTNSMEQQDKTSGMKYYISTQVLAAVAEEMENSYIQEHEQPTQVVLTGIGESKEEEKYSTHPNEKKKDGLISNSSSSTFHEDETQVIIEEQLQENNSREGENLDEVAGNSIIALHEAETQVIIDQEHAATLQTKVQSITETLQNAASNSLQGNAQLIVSCQEILEASLEGTSKNNSHIPQNSFQDKNIIDVNIKDIPDQESTNEAGTLVSVSNLDVKTQVITQDNDLVNPLGISDNVVRDTQNSFSGLDLESLDDSASDVIRPVKKSVNIFQSQDSTFEDFNEDNAKSDEMTLQDSKPGSSSNNEGFSSTTNMSLDDSETDKIRPVKKSMNIFESQDSEEIEEDSNDSVDFMTMQKITNTERYLDTQEHSTKNNMCINHEKNNVISKTYETDGSETDLDNEEIVKNSIHNDDGSETENEILEEKNETEKEQSKKNSSNIIRKESANETNKVNSESNINDKLNSSKEMNRLKKKTNILKKKNVVSDSDSETDCEIERKDKISVKVMSVCSDSDTDVESNVNDTEQNDKIQMENRKDNGSEGLILEESALEDDSLISDKPKRNENTHVNQNTYSRLSVGYNETLNDSDFIPPTQEENLRTISQNSKFDNSENDFKLGLTQMMDEDDTSQQNKLNSTTGSTENNKDETRDQNDELSELKDSQEKQKKFTFKKSSSGATKSADITLDYEEDIYQAQTQNMCEESSPKQNSSTNDHVFLQPTQEAPKKTRSNRDESIPDEDFYLLSTQRLDGSSKKNDIDDFYQQSTQKLVQESVEQTNDTSLELSRNELYQLPTQKLPENEKIETVVNNESNLNDSKDDDIFATQVMDVNDSPHRYVESELENMFATQRAVPTEDCLDKIEDIVRNKGIIEDKLPTEDKDLEAILATQRMLDSPKTPKKNDEAVPNVQKSLESQLEVLFASQPSNLPPDKFVRPPNPLVNILGDSQDTQELLKENSLKDEEKTADKHEESETSLTKQKKTCQIGLEQSFALLEAKSTKIRRSDRNKNCEEVSVSCPKTRVSMIVAPNDNKILEEELKPVKNKRSTLKRQPSTVNSSTKIDLKEPGKRKKRRMSEMSNSSDEENQSNVPSVSNKQNITNKILSRIQEIEDGVDMKSSVKIIERPETPTRKRSSRIQRVTTEEIVETTKDEYAKSYKTRPLKINKTSAPSTSNDTYEEGSSSRNESKDESKLKNRSKKFSEDSDNHDQEKSSRTRGSRLPKNGETDDEVKEKESSDKDKNEEKLEEKKTSKTRTSRVTKLAVLEEESSKVQDKKASKRDTKASDSGENKEVSRKRGKDTNSVKQLKDVQIPTTPSRTLKRGSSIQVTTPPKIQRLSEATPSSSRRKINVEDTPNRNKRKLKPKVVFTMMDDPQLESQIKQLGGSVVDSVDTCTVLITKCVKRTMKLLSAVGLSKPICSEEWVKQSKKENNFLDPWDFILVDKEAEKKWDFSLKTSLERSVQKKLFEDYTFQLLVTNAQDVLKGAIESCGGKIVTRIPKVANNFVVVAVPEQKDRYKKILKQHSNIIVVEPEAIFDGVLRQEIRFERHYLK